MASAGKKMETEFSRLKNEFHSRAGLGTSYTYEVRKESHLDKVIDSSEYTLDNFFNNYYVAIMKSNLTKWAVRLRRKDGIAEDDKIMRDVDWNDKSNSSARRSNDSSWLNCPVILEGCQEVKSLGDKTSIKGKNIPKRPMSKSSSKRTSSMDELLRKRKRYDSYSSSESSEDDILAYDDSSVLSSLKELSNLFAGDLLTAVDNEKLNRAFKMVSKICDAPTLEDSSLRGAASAINPNLQFTISSLGARLSYVISLDYQRRLTKLEKENAKLKAENSTNSDLIRKARERNDELIDLYNLSDEAANLPDEQIQVLETKKNKLIDEKDEIALKGAKALEKFQESIVEVPKERDLALSEKNVLVEERNLIRSQLLIESEAEFSWDARVLNDARENLAINVSLQAEHSALVKDIVSNYEDKEKNYLQKIEELETRLASEEEKNYPQKIEELETRLDSEEKDLSVRNSKYQQLKKNFIIMVSNNSNDANCARETAVKKVCVENNIPLTKYRFPEIPDNEHISDISDSEGENEESEEEMSGSEPERDEEK
ncbi:golgin IMH1-like [Papaver somniferum]|uniref:golgin IMH1-like n=1 Tax=Papaver somniferum TaxID=3469 RepID=UPI000E700C35|nr:golgin IMH1-like [Papaver somniferum]